MFITAAQLYSSDSVQVQFLLVAYVRFVILGLPATVLAGNKLNTLLSGKNFTHTKKNKRKKVLH